MPWIADCGADWSFHQNSLRRFLRRIYWRSLLAQVSKDWAGIKFSYARLIMKTFSYTNYYFTFHLYRFEAVAQDVIMRNRRLWVRFPLG